MLGGIIRGRDFRGVVSYVFNGRGGRSPGRGIALGGTVGGADPVAIADALEAIRSMRPDIARPVLHLWASSGPDGFLSPTAWLWIGQCLAERFGTDVWFAVAHDDTRNPHCHYILSRIRWDGTVAREALRDFQVVEDVMAEAERRFGLRRDPRPERAPGPHGRVPKRDRSTDRERRMTCARKTPMKDELRQAIQDCENAGHRGYRLLLAVQALGWTCDVRWRNGKPVGLSWRHTSGVTIPSRRLGDGYASTAFLRKIGGIPGMQGGRPLPRNWTPPPYRPRAVAWQADRSYSPLGAAAGCSWWGRAASWAWRAACAVIAPPIFMPRNSERPVIQPSRLSDPQRPQIAPRRR